MTSRLRQLTTNPKTLQADEKLALARQALAEGRKLEARRQAWEALAADPENVRAWLMLATLASPRASVEYIQRALDLRPYNPVAQRALEWAQARLREQQASRSPADVEAFQAVPKVEAPPPAAPTESGPAVTLIHAPATKAGSSPPAEGVGPLQAGAEPAASPESLAATVLNVRLAPAVEPPSPPALGETVAEVAWPAEEAPVGQEGVAAHPALTETVAEVVLPAGEAAPVEPVAAPTAASEAAPQPSAGAVPAEGDEEDESPTSPHKAVSGPRPGTHSSTTLLALAAVILVGVLAAVYFGQGTARAERPAAVAVAPLQDFQKSTLAPAPTDTPTVTPSPSPTPTLTPTPSITPTPPPFEAWAGGGAPRWIDVNLSLQMLTAMEGEAPVDTFMVSTGLWNTPTVTGDYHIYVKYPAADMSGPGYYLPQVPFVMYFHRDYGLHGTYWHNNFGHPMSHGCVNMRTDQAGWLYNWASVGTLVHVHY